MKKLIYILIALPMLFASCSQEEEILGNESVEMSFKAEIPAELQDAFEQLVYYPVTASANVVALYIYSAYNRYYAEKNDGRTNGYAALVEEALAKAERAYSKLEVKVY